MARGAFHSVEAFLVNQFRNESVGPKREKVPKPLGNEPFLVILRGALKELVL